MGLGKRYYVRLQMTAKAEVAKETLSVAEVEALCTYFPVALPIREHRPLFGGYSGTSIAVVGADGTKAVLKICNDYTVADATSQAAVAAHAAAAGFMGVCAPMLRKDGSGCVFPRADGTPVMMLTWVEGKAVDKVLSSGDVDKATILASVGAGLAALHSVPVSASTKLRACEKGSGACDVSKHISGELMRKMKGSVHTKAHPFVTECYMTECASLTQSMGAEGLPRGVLHGDPFLDNMLCDPKTVSATTSATHPPFRMLMLSPRVSQGELVGLVDLEDFCLGPLLFDVACCASACCFRDDGALDIRRLRALLEGYAAVRPLTPVERKHFLAFMRLTMLCNCTWRFINFNIDHREIEECRNAHVEVSRQD